MSTTESSTQRLLARLGRITSGGELIPQLDGLRFVAIALVVLFHARGYLVDRTLFDPGSAPASAVASALALGRNGVELFFAISGFILALPFARARAESRPLELRRYFVRRLTRIEPPYVLVLLLYFLGYVLVKGVPFGELAPHLLASAFYVHNLVYGAASTVNPVAWSLEVEVQFYLLAPALSLVFAIRGAVARRAVLVGLWSVAIAGKLALPTGGRLAMTILPFLEFFWAGFLLAELHTARRRPGPGEGRGWDLVSLAAWPLLFAIWASPLATRWLFAPAALVVCAAALRGPASARLFASPWIVTLGGMCYSIYLVHTGVIAWVSRLTRDALVGPSFAFTLLPRLAVVLAAVLLVAGALFVLVERPCMRPGWPRALQAWWGARSAPTKGAPT